MIETLHKSPGQSQSLRGNRWLNPRRLGIVLALLVVGVAPALASEPPDMVRTPRDRSRPPVPPAAAQTPPRRSLLRQGSQLIVNGRTLSIPWGQWQTGPNTRIGVIDWGLVQALGARFLNTTDPARQPITWFSVSANLAPFLTQQFRYLDITDIAHQAGWQTQIEGDALRITAPPAQVMTLRQGRQPWGDRLVLELDRPTPWQIDRRQETAITLDAVADPTLVQDWQPLPNSPLQSLKLETLNNRTTLRLEGIPALPVQLFTLANPNRLVIDIGSAPPIEQDILWAPGLRWQQRTIPLASGSFPVIWLTLNPRQTGLRLRPILPVPAGVQGIAPLVQTARQSAVAAAINGGFFNRNNQLPLGAIRRDGRWLSGPILNRGAIAWNDRGEFRFARLTLDEILITARGDRLPLTNLNSGFVRAGIARYTPDWGSTYIPLTDNEILVTVQNNQVIRQQPGGSTGEKTPVPIPPQGYLLVLRANQSATRLLETGTQLRIESTLTPPEFNPFPQVIGAGPLLVQDRRIVLDPQAEQFSPAFAREIAARSAIGRTADGNLLIVAIPGRAGNRGASLTETAEIMQQLGAIDALNLDGGSSTTLYLGGQLLDPPAPFTARVHNGLGIFLQP